MQKKGENSPLEAKLLLYRSIALLCCLIAAVSAHADVHAESLTADWQFTDVKNLDPWGDSDSDATDIMAAYVRSDGPATLAMRIDYMNIAEGLDSQSIIALDFAEQGTSRLSGTDDSLVADIEWDLLIEASNGDGTIVVYRPDFSIEANASSTYEAEYELDFVALELAGTAVEQIDTSQLRIQIFTISDSIADKSSVFAMDETVGRAKLVLNFMNAFIGYGPHAVSWYDGFSMASYRRPGARRGLKYLLDAIERYNIPLTINDLRIAEFPGNEYLGVLDRLRALQQKNLLDALFTLAYGHFMPWHDDFVDGNAIRIAERFRNEFGINTSHVMYPYEGLVTIGDIDTIKEAGFTNLFLLDRYRYIFGWITDWSNFETVKAEIESVRKIHRLNGVNLFFDSRIGNYSGIAADARWEAIDWSTYQEYDMYYGTDRGLHLWWRRILYDMAMGDDQEQYFTIGTDLDLTAWLFQDAAEWNVKWIAAHPWIEVTTFTELSNRNWDPVVHADIQGSSDQPIERFQLNNDNHYNAYFWQYYYGGISDGHSPLVASGDTIEAFYDYIPYLRDGARIPSSKTMGDSVTPGSIIHETIQNFRSAPDNNITELAWLQYLHLTGDMTFHSQTAYQPGESDKGDWGGKYLHYASKFRSNYIGHVNKLLFAANWAEDASAGSVSSVSLAQERDLDLDGENEHVLLNDRALLILENDGGRVEYAFARTPDGQPIQVVAPTAQLTSIHASNTTKNYQDGEIALLSDWNQYPDALFMDGLDYGEYAGSIDGDSIKFVSPNTQIEKSISLSDYDITATYTNHGAAIEIGMGFVTNLYSMFTKDWDGKLKYLDHPSAHGWYNSDGGVTAVYHATTPLGAMNSFLDSPAGTEQAERQDYSGYASGHWFYYPFSTLTVWGNSAFQIVVTLGPVYEPGDIDGNGTVGLSDAILALKCASDSAATIVGPAAGTDADGDRMIGLAEAVYILQKLAGLRARAEISSQMSGVEAPS